MQDDMKIKFQQLLATLFPRSWKNMFFGFLSFPEYYILGYNMAKYAKYAYLGAYLGARNMVKWGVPEKILQNAVQTRWS